MNDKPRLKRVLWPYPVIIVLICCCCLCCWYCCFWRCCRWCEDNTTVILVRHAEKASGYGDVPLTPDGEIRANELIDVLDQANITAVYSTVTIRTQMTAEPIASHLGLDILPYSDPTALADIIKTEHAGEVVLVVGHSDTVPSTIEALGAGSMSPLTGFDNLFIVTLCGSDDARLIKAEYGSDG